MTGQRQLGIRGKLSVVCATAGMAVGVSLAAQPTLPAGDFVIEVPDGRTCMGIVATKVCPRRGAPATARTRTT